MPHALQLMHARTKVACQDKEKLEVSSHCSSTVSDNVLLLLDFRLVSGVSYLVSV